MLGCNSLTKPIQISDERPKLCYGLPWSRVFTCGSNSSPNLECVVKEETEETNNGGLVCMTGEIEVGQFTRSAGKQGCRLAGPAPPALVAALGGDELRPRLDSSG